MKLLFVGDVMLGRLVDEVLQARPPESVWGDTLPDFAAADLRACNLECALTDVGEPWTRTPKAFHFRSAERNVAALAAAGVDIVSLANNHVLDFNEAGLLRTLAVLDEAGIAHAGAGRDLAEASAPAIRRVSGRRVGMLAFTDNEPDWAATHSAPGVFHVDPGADDERAELLLDATRETRAAVDLLIVSAHWGSNWGAEPPGDHVSFGRALLDAGADIVFGHSCHTLRGVGLHGTGAILYGTGDFVDDYAVDPIERNDHAAIFVVEAVEHEIRRITIKPTVVRDFAAWHATDPDRGQIVRRMAGLCRALGTEARPADDESALEIPIWSQRGWPTGIR